MKILPSAMFSHYLTQIRLTAWSYNVAVENMALDSEFKYFQ